MRRQQGQAPQRISPHIRRRQYEGPPPFSPPYICNRMKKILLGASHLVRFFFFLKKETKPFSPSSFLYYVYTSSLLYFCSLLFLRLLSFLFFIIIFLNVISRFSRKFHCTPHSMLVAPVSVFWLRNTNVCSIVAPADVLEHSCKKIWRCRVHIKYACWFCRTVSHGSSWGVPRFTKSALMTSPTSHLLVLGSSDLEGGSVGVNKSMDSSEKILADFLPGQKHRQCGLYRPPFLWDWKQKNEKKKEESNRGVFPSDFVHIFSHCQKLCSRIFAYHHYCLGYQPNSFQSHVTAMRST